MEQGVCRSVHKYMKSAGLGTCVGFRSKAEGAAKKESEISDRESGISDNDEQGLGNAPIWSAVTRQPLWYDAQ